jgi:hypothetical protein
MDAAVMERTAATARKIRNAFKVRMGFINSRAASEIAGMEKIIIGLQAMFEFGNRNGREAIKMAVRRSIASEE